MAASNQDIIKRRHSGKLRRACANMPNASNNWLKVYEDEQPQAA